MSKVGIKLDPRVTFVKTQSFYVMHMTTCKPMKPVKGMTVNASPKKAARKSPKKSPKKKAAPKKVQEDDDDDDDLFGDDDDEDEEAAKAAAKKRSDAAKKTKEKKKVIERSQVVLEVKPWEAETDLEELAIKIKATEIKGLKWGEGHKLVPVAFGIKKLLVQCIIIDDEVLLDDITDKIEAFEDYVQSVDVASMNKV